MDYVNGFPMTAYVLSAEKLSALTSRSARSGARDPQRVEPHRQPLVFLGTGLLDMGAHPVLHVPRTRASWTSSS